jgi:hypothetical protein
MINVNKQIKDIAKAKTYKYERHFRKAIEMSTINELVAFDDFCAIRGVPVRQESLVLRQLYFGVVFYDIDLTDYLCRLYEYIQYDRLADWFEDELRI